MEKFNKISKIFIQNISIFIISLSIIAFFFPDYFKWMINYTTIFLAVAMFGMGTSIDGTSFKNIFIHPKEVIIGCLAQYTIMPLLAWMLVTLFKLPLDLALGVILIASCPG